MGTWRKPNPKYTSLGEGAGVVAPRVTKEGICLDLYLIKNSVADCHSAVFVILSCVNIKENLNRNHYKSSLEHNLKSRKSSFLFIHTATHIKKSEICDNS